MLSMLLLCGCQGVNGGGWAHYVGQEKVRPITGFGVVAFATRLDPPAASAGDDVVLVPGDRPVALRALRRRRADEPARARCAEGQALCGHRRAVGPHGLAPELPDAQPQPARPLRRGGGRGQGARAARDRRAAGRAPALRRRGPRRPRELPARADALAGEPARLVVQGARVLPASTCSAWTRRRSRRRRPVPSSARPRSSGASEAPTGKLDLLHDDRLPHERVGAVLGHRPAGRHLVREARHLQHGPPSVRARVRPGRPAAVGGAQRLGRLHVASPSASRSWRRSTSACAATSLPRRCCTTRPRSWHSPAGSCATGRPASASRSPGRRCPSSSSSSATTASSTTR